MRVRFERITAAQEPYPHINDTQTKAQVIYFNPSIAHHANLLLCAKIGTACRELLNVRN